MEKNTTSDIGERFSLDSVIEGLATDLQALRAGSISITDAMARAMLAKQIFNGLRLVITGRKILERDARQIESPKA